jgi:hypothetical protein
MTGPDDNEAIQRLVERMRAAGIPITRENFLRKAFGNHVPEWVDEEHLPSELRITDNESGD